MIENITLSLVLDGIILILLVATIIYTARLSLYLKKFKENRKELKKIIKELSSHIDKADKAIDGLHDVAADAGQDLQLRLNKANSMFDELDMVVQTGDALANRLEDLAIKNRKIIEGGESDLSDLAKATSYNSRVKSRVKSLVNDIDAQDENKKDSKLSAFSIRDPEMERGDNVGDGGILLDDNEVLSDAERDLYESIQQNKKIKKV